ncbi:NHL repeat-containing protein [Mahella australiensis]|uniref:NHL repeat containing protein n=1 Tax=Mahella australiensis (strain DSM 15567 / CIP 107919 / 50-1 BON) TaxID=697281 RepID=F3ZV97_MAHA5|nr:tetratricopeptide repeat protein [Mahella australiensis]AEE95247.1 NHL repeat containing protein [Mahella australiensis 50-1 BON]
MRKLWAILAMTMVLVFVWPFNAKAGDDTDYVLGNDMRRIPIPVTYSVSKVIINLGDKVGPLNQAEDLFIDERGLLYVVDTGNARIIKLDKKGAVLGVYGGPKDKPFNTPKGVFVDWSGDMYVADTGNGRIVHLSQDGEFVEEFTKPESSLIDPNYPFKPAKIAIDATGYIYILNESDYHGFITIDAYNRFRGYVAPTRLPFSLTQTLVRFFATPEQKEQLAKQLPPSHSNFVIHDDGMIYATTSYVNNDQIKKLNSIGKNIYKHDISFGEHLDDAGNPIVPNFVDIAVDKNGIINALEAESRKIYQYDRDGNLLTVFGGLGSWKGRLDSPSSLVVDDDGNIYVLDKALNNIQVFEPTAFMKYIHQALALYYDGRYQEAVTPWQEVLKIDANYELAHRGIAKAFMKQERWREAMAEYRAGDDQEGYSRAFSEYRHQLYRQYFGLVVLAIIAITVLIYWAIRHLKALSDTTLYEIITWQGGSKRWI